MLIQIPKIRREGGERHAEYRSSRIRMQVLSFAAIFACKVNVSSDFLFIRRPQSSRRRRAVDRREIRSTLSLSRAKDKFKLYAKRIKNRARAIPPLYYP